MDEKNFVWTSELSRRLFELRFEHDWLFKKKKQPWGEFHKLLLDNGFPEEMTINHVRKKWSYTYDTYKIAKKSKNKSWKYYKLFDKHYAKSKILDKYESWSDEWRLKLITCISETKGMKMDLLTMWRTVEKAMRSQDLPMDCCMQDIKGLWQHVRTTFNRKHRLKLKKGAELSEWPLYDSVLNYFQAHEPDYLVKLETEASCGFVIRKRGKGRYRKKTTDNNDNESEFQWSKDITETFIQIRLQNDWLFSQKKWAWNDLLSIMLHEYGFPKTLTSREICRKWAATFSEYQKARATNNKLWVYYNLFEVYLGEGGNLSLNPLVNWQEEWVHNLISTRVDLEHLFKISLKDQSSGWREVEKRLRSIGLPLDHSLLDLPLIWTHLLKTFRWKRKFANKGILNEQWPYFEAMAQYVETQARPPPRTRRPPPPHADAELHDAPAHDDDFEDDMKLFDLKQRLQVNPKYEAESTSCRSCWNEDACVNIFERSDDQGLDLAHKLRAIGGVEVDQSDSLPRLLCLNCLRELEDAYKFRIKCQDVDKHLRTNNIPRNIKIEIEKVENEENEDQNNIDDSKNDDRTDMDDTDAHYDDVPIVPEVVQPVKKEPPKVMKKRKKARKLKYDYWKICEVCGKHTRNLVAHLDMHSTSKTYSCDVCDKKFKFKSGLVIHKAIHDPTPRKTCEVCGKTFHILAQYRRHFVYHANERKFECETCGKRFNTLDILKVHNRTHTDERPFSCPDCGKSFRTAGCVSRHKRIVHTRNAAKIQ